MATAPMPTSSAARRAEIMRQAWQPVQQRLSSGANTTFDFLAERPALAQGIYYVLTGLWPWFALGSFLWITGPKHDIWLVQTVGALVFVLGAALCVAAYCRETSPAIICLALGTAAALIFVDVLFVMQGRISWVYLLDAVLEGGAVALWVHAWRGGRLQAGSTRQAAAEQPAAALQAPVAQVVTAWPEMPAPVAAEPIRNQFPRSAA